jgi:hypothetical protein
MKLANFHPSCDPHFITNCISNSLIMISEHYIPCWMSIETGLGILKLVVVEIGTISNLQNCETLHWHSSRNFHPSDISQYLEIAQLALNILLICLGDSGCKGAEFQIELVEKSSGVGSPLSFLQPPYQPPHESANSWSNSMPFGTE